VRENDGRKLDHKTLEQIRIRAVRQILKGESVKDLARALGLSESAVFAWWAAYRKGGEGALRARPVPGRKPTLTVEQMSQLYAIVVGHDPRQLQFDFALWTREVIREVIRREFGVKLAVTTVGRLPRKLGMSPQRPLRRAHQQNPEAVERWKTETYPAIRARAEAEGATIYFADEAGIRSDHHSGSTWAPAGRTPVVKSTGARHSVNMISATTPKARCALLSSRAPPTPRPSSSSAAACSTTVPGRSS
jgi:transposase